MKNWARGCYWRSKVWLNPRFSGGEALTGASCGSDNRCRHRLRDGSYLWDDETTGIRWILMRRMLDSHAVAGLRQMKLTMTDWRLLGVIHNGVFSDACFHKLHNLRFNILLHTQLAPICINFSTIFTSLSVASLPLLRSVGFTNFLLFLQLLSILYSLRFAWLSLEHIF